MTARGPNREGPIRIALAGNPNVGKSTVFNALTGGRQHVGNYPGVTVEKKQGWFEYEGRRVDVVDLPGTFSLAAHTLEECVACAYLLDERPDVVVHIADASRLEQHLYLTTELLELGLPLVLVLNKSDLAWAEGREIDAGLLERLLGVPVVSTVGHKGEGLGALKEAVARAVRGTARDAVVRLGEEVEREVDALAGLLKAARPELWPPHRWWAIRLLEGDAWARERLRPLLHGQENILEEASAARDRLRRAYGEDAGVLIADRRYGFISGACQEAARKVAAAKARLSDHVDAILLHPVLGLPIFLGMMYLVFRMTFGLGLPLQRLAEGLLDALSRALRATWPGPPSSAGLALLADGVLGGVGNVLVFLPNVFLLFLAITMLEDTGYMARAVFLVDRLMHRVGLHGKSFIPLLIGFGCTVPAILATRVIESRRDRLATMLVLPLISCGARLPIYTLIIPAFFPPAWQAPVLFGVYLTGVAAALLLVRLLRSTLLRGESEPFVMELPPYALPTLRSLGRHAWERCAAYLRRAGTVILGVSVVMWFLATWPRGAGGAPAPLVESYAGRLGRALEPALRPLGFDWKISTALLGAFVAKEVFVAQLGVVHAVAQGGEGREALREELRESYPPLVAVCILLFLLLGLPCAATVAATRAEAGSWGWALFQLVGLTAFAYIVTGLVYQAGRALGLGLGA